MTFGNAYAERFVRTIKENCLEQMILFGEDSLRNSIRQFVDHYHLERNHQGLGNGLIIPMKGTINTEARIERRERLGGLLSVGIVRVVATPVNRWRRQDISCSA